MQTPPNPFYLYLSFLTTPSMRYNNHLRTKITDESVAVVKSSTHSPVSTSRTKDKCQDRRTRARTSHQLPSTRRLPMSRRRKPLTASPATFHDVVELRISIPCHIPLRV
ncbi:uncharacterized protein BDR25DRAFT_350595 [Lindgomyces ingoldianus]|uniref:Uncharacterized protein n=1 Tax=Lindgomyces ingoldianus TaxID=673940 RepID=A0ACB6RA28_9PLEO|nr:uncharacterized protein BDR25DRAFT_350595 [Lindgomyces ingoldianus]KAF2475190.1 hypothetical protein BDR25DRAFT_350595 [Lindgomyces ingoldianus]